nr:hypothetical protein [uncultured Fluviicola sp.]
MKKILFVLLINLLVSESLMSQECKNQTDPFTNEPLLEFDYSPYNIRYLHIEIKNDKRIMEFRAVENTAVIYTIPKGAEVLMKLENGDIIRLYTLNETSSTVGTANASGFAMTYSEYYLKMEITVEQLQKLASFKITNLRYPNLHGGNTDDEADDLRKGFRKSFMQGAKCILGIN